VSIITRIKVGIKININEANRKIRLKKTTEKKEVSTE
jgi:hypothetical protein